MPMPHRRASSAPEGGIIEERNTMPRGKRIVGTAAAALLLCSSIAMPATAAEGTDASASASSALEALTSQSSTPETSNGADAAIKQTEDALNASADSANASVDSANAAGSASGDETASAEKAAATPAPVADTASLKTLLDSTEEGDLKPLASGWRADDSGTAPYDTWKANADDLKALKEARTAAQKIVDDGSATEEQITAAADKLQSAFDAVRFIYHYTGITGTNGARMFDDKGDLIQAHGAGIMRAKTSTLAAADQKLDANGDGYVYIWCGEDKTDRLVAHGVRIYYSDDLLNWVDKGLGFQTYLGDQDLQDKLNGADKIYQKYYNVDNIASDPDYTNIYGKDFSVFANDASNYNVDSPQAALDKLLWDLKALYGDGSNPTKTSCVFERPKMIYNAKTKRWVIWFHADGPKYGDEDTATYSKAKGGVAISTTSDPAGPYKYLGSFRLNTGDNSGNPGMLRDMNLYTDEGKDENNDGVEDAYLVYASDENTDMTISLLDSTYTKLAKPISEEQRGTSVKDGDTYNTVSWDSRESPAPVKWNGRYYIIYSHTTGWAPNQNEYMVSEGDNIMGPYSNGGVPFVAGDGYEQSPSNSFYTQSSSVIPVDPEKGLFIYWGDRWFNPDTGADISQSRYVMTPIQFSGDKLRVIPRGDWTLDELNQYEAVNVVTKLPETAGSVSSLIASLPDKLEVQRGGEDKTTTTKVVWNAYVGDDQPMGEVTVTGTLPELNGVTVAHTATIYPENTFLFMDAASTAGDESDYFTTLKKYSKDVAKQQASDQVYSEDNGWGLASEIGTDVERYDATSNDTYETGYWAKSGKDILYKADLKAGTYTVKAGYRDWWGQYNGRTVNFAAWNGDDWLAGADVTVSNKTGAWNSTSGALTFTLDKDATVTFVTSQRSGGDPVLSWVSVQRQADDAAVSVEPVAGTVAFVDGTTPALPDKVNVKLADGSTVERKVDWKADASKLKAYAPTEVQGIVEGTTLPATATVQKIESNLDYFIDVNGGDASATYDSAAKLTDGGLKNAKADQAFTEADGWGNASSNYGVKNDGNADPYESGIYAGEDGNNGTLSYKLTLEPGTHTVSLGMHDWWSQTRGTSITYSYDGMSVAQELAYASVNSGKVIASGDVTIPAGEAKTVTFTLTSATGTGPVLSWISATKATSVPDPDPTPATPVSAAETTATVKAGETPKLPETVKVTYSDGSVKDVKVTWDAHDWSAETAAGTVTLGGDLEGIDSTLLRAKAVVTVEAADPDPDPDPDPNPDPTPINAIPEIHGAGDVTITEGTTFDALAGVTATDEEDGTITDRIAVEGSVDTAKPGVYKLTYTVSDSGGATATVVRTVTVKAKEATKPEATKPNGAKPQGDKLIQTGTDVALGALAATALAGAGIALATARRRRSGDR